MKTFSKNTAWMSLAFVVVFCAACTLASPSPAPTAPGSPTPTLPPTEPPSPTVSLTPWVTPTLPTQPTPTRWFTPTPTAQQSPRQGEERTPPGAVNAVSVNLWVRSSTSSVPEMEIGTKIVVEATFQPAQIVLTRRADGSVASVSTQYRDDIEVAQMRFCLGKGAVCSLPGEWRPFQETITSEVEVDWLGPRTFILSVEFRDPSGAALPAMHSSLKQPASPAQVSLNVSGRVGANTPLEKLPAPVRTALAVTRAAFPVTGSALIENGRCCAGGLAGSQVSLQVQFQASSTGGKVTEMRVRPGGTCFQEPAQMAQAAWEPFQSTKTYSTTLALNWVGWWISVQYRDAAGNLSPVYCDDISLEGSPPNK